MRVNYKHSEETKKKMSEAWKTRPPISITTREKLSKAGKDNKNGLGFKHTEEMLRKRKLLNSERIAKGISIGKPFKIGHCPSQETREKWSRNRKGKQFRLGTKASAETRMKISLKLRGEKAPNWKGGVTLENGIIRSSLEMRLWRESVFKRDNWSCRMCAKRGIKLHAHHIKSFSEYPEVRYAIDNGLTVCIDCHRKLHPEVNVMKLKSA